MPSRPLRGTGKSGSDGRRYAVESILFRSSPVPSANVLVARCFNAVVFILSVRRSRGRFHFFLSNP
jgi:hypothetical protein